VWEFKSGCSSAKLIHKSRWPLKLSQECLDIHENSSEALDICCNSTVNAVLQVRPHVEGDLLRLWSDTVAWQARQKPEEFMNIQQPLYDINTFTSNQVCAFASCRISQEFSIT